jgi:asparagine synthase (glutamine-hydrolysing)
VFGFKPLVWTSCDGEVRVASEVQALTTSSSPIDEAMVGELLSGLVASRSATVYRLVARIEPGAMLVVDAAGTRVTPLLSLALAGGDGSSQSRAERHEEFRARLLDAVRRRTSDTTRAGVMLSGGLDSATVLAAARRTAGWVDAWTVAQASACDETPRARETVSHCGGAHHVAPATARSYDYQASVRRHRDLPIPPPCANSVGLRRAASAAGARVLLTGLGGDEWFGRSLWHAADLLRAGRISAVARSWSRSMTARNPPRFSAVVQATVAPFVPAVFRPLARRAVAQTATPWIRGDWARRVDLHERLRVRPTIDAPTIALRARLLDVLSGASVLANEQDDRVAAEAGIEDRAPYFDQALVEFALSLPAADADAERPKGFVRDACAAWLPALHATPEPALDFSHLFVDALDALGGRPFFARLRAVEAGWVEPSWVARALGEAWGGKPAPSRAAARGLWHVAAVETWLRTLD